MATAKKVPAGFKPLDEKTRTEALKKAAETRKKRSAVMAKVKAGNLKFSTIIKKKDDPIYGKLKVKSVIMALPGWGKITTEKLLDEVGVMEGRRIAGLGSKQVEKLVEKLG